MKVHVRRFDAPISISLGFFGATDIYPTAVVSGRGASLSCELDGTGIGSTTIVMASTWKTFQVVFARGYQLSREEITDILDEIQDASICGDEYLITVHRPDPDPTIVSEQLDEKFGHPDTDILNP